MPLWKIVPVTDSDDPRWLDHEVWREVVVRAPTVAEALVLASDMERDRRSDRVPAGNESLSFSSGFEDEKLYRINRVASDQEPDVTSDGQPEIVRAILAS